MGTDNSNRTSNGSGARTNERPSRNDGRSTYAEVEKRAVKNPVPGDGGKNK